MSDAWPQALLYTERGQWLRPGLYMDTLRLWRPQPMQDVD